MSSLPTLDSPLGVGSWYGATHVLSSPNSEWLTQIWEPLKKVAHSIPLWSMSMTGDFTPPLPRGVTGKPESIVQVWLAGA
jgi:hypothetical protein